jgi:hypothetical protein
VTHTGLGGGQFRVGDEMHVGPQDVVALLIEDDRSVHLRELEESLRGEVGADGEPAVAERLNRVPVADDDERTGPCRDDVV